MNEKAKGYRSGRPRGVSLLGLAALTCVVAVLAHACGDDDGDITSVPVPGELVISVVSPNGPEGAAVLETEDRGVLSVASAPSGQVFIGGTQLLTRIIVILSEPGPIVATLNVADVNDPPRFRIVEVADDSNVVRESLGGYSLSMRPASGSFEAVGGGR